MGPMKRINDALTLFRVTNREITAAFGRDVPHRVVMNVDRRIHGATWRLGTLEWLVKRLAGYR